MPDDELWMVGIYRSGEFPSVIWEFIGVFDKKEKAIRACIKENYFMAKIFLNEAFPDETMTVPTEYPLWQLTQKY